MRHRRILFFCLLFLLTGTADLMSQSSLFHRDSLQVWESPDPLPPVKSLPGALLKGIAAANFKKTNPIELIPYTALELPRLYLSTPMPHPRLITPMQLRHARQNRFRAPQQQWYQLMKDRVEKYMSSNNLQLRGLLFRQAEDIKTLAFLYHIDNDTRYLQAAILLLEQLPEPPVIINLEGGANSTGWGDFLLSAQALMPLCVALDLLYNDMPPDLRQTVRRKLTQVSQQLLDGMLYTPANNHVTVMAAATLTAAILEDQPELFINNGRQNIWQQGIEYLSRALGLIAPDGGYIEGVYYGQYITGYLAPFSLYFRNATGISLYRHPYLERMVNWMIANEKGSGRYAAFDDAFQVRPFSLPLLIPQSRLRQTWHAFWQTLPPDNFFHNNMAEGMAVFTPLAGKISAAVPAVQFFYESGMTVFRDRHLQPNIYAAFLSEREEWFASRHEHVDPFSMEISAYGNDLIVDGGYGGGVYDDNRAWFVSAQANNSLLVDGRGTYQNPIWGDPIASEITHAYQTSRSAAVSMRHSISDVRLQRRAFFLENKYILMLDHFEGSREHTVSQNFNYLGNFRQESPNVMTVQNGDANLQMIALSSTPEKPLISENHGLYTPQVASRPLNSFQIGHAPAMHGSLLTLFYPHEEGAAPLYPEWVPIIGDGEVIRFDLPESPFAAMDIAMNYADSLRSDRWQSDARTLMAQFDAAGRITALLLNNFTHFRSQDLTLECDFPITLFLERADHAWQGHIDTAPAHRYTLTISGIAEVPLRFNRQVEIPLSETSATRKFHLQGPGTLDIGATTAVVRIPYRYHHVPNLISWLNQQPNARRSYEGMFTAHQQLFRNRIAYEMMQGLTSGLLNRQQQWLNGSHFLEHAYFVLSGVSQASYNRDSPSTFSLSLPHRYHFNGRVRNWQWQAFEEGTFSTSSFRVQNIALSARTQGGAGLSYRGGFWIDDHRSHEVRLIGNNGSQIFYQDNSFQDDYQRQAQLQYRAGSMLFNPGYRWEKNSSNNNAFLNWRFRQLNGFFQKTTTAGESEYRQFIGAYRRSWAFTLQGWQNDQRKLQEYNAHWQIHPFRQLRISQGTHWQYNRRWEMPRGYSEITWHSPGLALRGKISKIADTWQPAAAFYWRQKQHYLQGALDLSELDFRPGNRLRLQWDFHSLSSWRIGTRLDHSYRNENTGSTTEVFHSFALPVGNHLWMPVIGETLTKAKPLQWIGSGFLLQWQHTLYGQLVANRQLAQTVVDYQLNATINDRQQLPMFDIWVHLRQAGEKLQESEIRVSPVNSSITPGIYYSYLRGGGSRLEGYLQWRW